MAVFNYMDVENSCSESSISLTTMLYIMCSASTGHKTLLLNNILQNLAQHIANNRHLIGIKDVGQMCVVIAWKL